MPQERREHVYLLLEEREVGAEITARERDGDGRNAERQTLHRRGDRARIEHVLTHVLTMIDAAEHEVGSRRHERFDGEHHAVGGCAVDLPFLLAATNGTQRMMQRE